MNELTQFLTKSLSDGRISGGEKSALAEWIEKNVRTEQERGLARHTLFDVARTATLPPAALLDWLEDAMKAVEPLRKADAAAAVSEACFSPGDGCLATIVNRLANCRRFADLCVFTITDDRITRAILDAHRRRVKLRILTDNDKAGDRGSDIDELAAAGIPVRVDATPYHMHHKFAIFDGTHLLNGSYNWTRGAAEQNFENLTVTSDAKLVAAFQDEFEKIWLKLAR